MRRSKPTVEQIRKDLLKNGHKVFTVWFYKRSDGSLRKMVCRLHVRKGVKGVVPYDVSLQRDIDNNLIRVFEMAGENSGFKCIPLDSIIRYTFTAPDPQWENADWDELTNSKSKSE